MPRVAGCGHAQSQGEHAEHPGATGGHGRPSGGAAGGDVHPDRCRLPPSVLRAQRRRQVDHNGATVFRSSFNTSFTGRIH